MLDYTTDSAFIQPLYREIPLTQGKVALVDAADCDYLMQWKWCAVNNRNLWYAERQVRVEGKKTHIRMHALLLGQKGVDHINHDSLDNRRANLRIVTHQQNTFNQRAARGSSSVFKGVGWHKASGQWRARIVPGGKEHHLGFFDDELKAATAYDDAARKLFGPFAHLNFPGVPHR